MRFLLALLLTAAFAGLLGLWLPYWSLSLAALVVGFLIHPGGWKAFVAGLLGAGLLWGILAWNADSANAHILATRIGMLFGGASASTMVLITAALGGLLGGLGVLVGDRIRNAVS